MRDSFVFYKSFMEAARFLPDDERLRFYDILTAYALDDVEPKNEGSAYGMFLMARPQIDANQKRYESAKKGGKAKANKCRTSAKDVPNVCQSGAEAVPNVNVNDNVLKEKILPSGNIQKKSSRFSPPTTEDVRQYIAEKGYKVDAERFVDFYNSKDWMIGKNRMKDWKAAVRNWERSSSVRKESTAKPNKFNNFEQRTYDYSSLENALFEKNRRELGDA